MFRRTWVTVAWMLWLGYAAAAAGYVQVNAGAGVEVFVDGEFVGVTREDVGGLLLTDVQPGERQLRFALAGFAPREVTVVVVAGRVLVHDVQRFEPELRIGEAGERAATELRKLTGTLVVQSLPVGAVIDVPSLRLAGQRKTRDVWTVERVPVGVHEVRVAALGRSVSADVEIFDGEVTRVFAFLGVDPPRIEVIRREGNAVAIERVEPSPVRSSQTRQTVRIFGEGFVPASSVTVYWGDREYPIPAERTTYVDVGRIDILAGLFPGGPGWALVVENPGGGRSERFGFAVVD